MNRFSISLKTVITLAFCGVILFPLSAQTFSKQRVNQLIRKSLQNKMKMTEADMHQGMELLRNHSPQTNAASTDQALRTRAADNAISESAETESEIHAAINPTDSNNIIVAAMKFDGENILSTLTFPIYYTNDFGQTWKLSTFNGANDLTGFTLIVGGGDPIIVFDDKGVAYLSWLTLSIGLDFKIKAQLHWAVSRDGGASWKRQESLLDAGELQDITASAGFLPDKEWLASDLYSEQHKGNVYVAYAYLNSIDTSYNIFVKTKRSNSETFSAAVDVTPEEIAFAQFTSIDVDAQGTVHLMFAGATIEDEVLSLYHTKSTDGGLSFSDPIKISSLHLQCFPPGSDENCGIVGIDPNRVYPCPHLRVDRSGSETNGNLYAVWTADGITNQKTEGLDVYFSKSEDGGKTWTSPIILNNNGDAKTHQFFPSLAVNDLGNVVITWYDRRDDVDNLMTQYYMTISKDGGNTFEQDFSVSSEASDFSVIGQANGNFGVGEYTQVVATNGYALPFWADGRTNDGNIEIFTTLIPLGEGQTTDVDDVISVSSPLQVAAVFPNPAKDIATLDLELQQPLDLQIKLFSNDGKVVRVYPSQNLPSGGHRLKLDVRGIAAGQYWVVIRSATGIKAKSLIVK